MHEIKKGVFERAADGCHKWGWVINLVVMIMMFAYFTGEMRSALSATQERLTRVENMLDQIFLKSTKP